MPCPDVCHARNGEASTGPQDSAGLPIVYQEASNMIRTTVTESLEDCKLQVAQLARDETHLEVELHSIEQALLHAQKQKRSLEDKILQLDQPLSSDLETVDLCDEDMQILDNASKIETDIQSSIKESSDVPPSIPLLQSGAACTTELIAPHSIVRLGTSTEHAERDPLQSEVQSHIVSAPADLHCAPRHLGNVPAMSPLPEDNSVAAILAGNRYRSAVSCINSVQRLPSHIQQAVFGAQHYMSGRQWIMAVKPQAGTAWSLPGIQNTLRKHRDQAQELSAALQALLDEQRSNAESGAQQLAAQLWSAQPQPHSFTHHPGRGAVNEHLHNFRCAMPAQMNQRQQWRNIFVDSGALVEDPVALLQETSFTSPWTKREREVMDSTLGEHGKRFAYVAKEVGSRSIADCIDRYYKVHLRDEFKPTWRKMARIKRAVDGKHKREEHSKVLAPVGKVSSRPRHSAWSGGALHMGASPAMHWPPMSTTRLTAAVSETAGDFGMTIASLGSEHEPNRPSGRHQGRRRANTTALEKLHVAGPAQTVPIGLLSDTETLPISTAAMLPFLSDQTAGSVREPVLMSGLQFPGAHGGGHVPANAPLIGLGKNLQPSTQQRSSIEYAEQVPALQIQSLWTQTCSRSGAVAEVSHAGFDGPSCGNIPTSTTGLAATEHLIRGSGISNPAQHTAADKCVQVQCARLTQDTTAEVPQAVVSTHVAHETNDFSPQAKGVIPQLEMDHVCADQTQRVAVTDAYTDQVMHVVQGHSPQQHLS